MMGESTAGACELDQLLYRHLVRIRQVEERIALEYPRDQITSPVHLSIGQEAVAVGVCLPLERDDALFGSHRSHACYLAKGGSLRGMIAELYGRSTGVAKGKAGSMHLIDVSAGMWGASAIVAANIPQAVGYALAIQQRGERRVVVSFFGEGATEEGVFYESLNFAALKRLPVLFVCENNFYSIHSRQKSRQAVTDLCRRAAAQGVQTECFQDLDIDRLYARTSQTVAELRHGRMPPMLFECHCYRWRGHVGPNDDYQAGYRGASELEPWQAADALVAVGRRLSDAVRQAIERDVAAEIDDAFQFAQQSPFPPAAELYTDLYA